MRRRLLLLLISFFVAVPPTQSPAGETKLVVGWVETVRILPGNLMIEAKMDTGADHSSIHVPEMTMFEREGRQWVRFGLRDKEGKLVELERMVVRKARIKRHDSKNQQRPVVSLGICLGSLYREVEVNLIDRSRFKLPMLIGRSFMGDGIVVDPTLQFTQEPACPAMPKP
ncbi:MAG: RimK/LysX family protein [Pseudomonadota bacterium]